MKCGENFWEVQRDTFLKHPVEFKRLVIIAPGNGAALGVGGCRPCVGGGAVLLDISCRELSLSPFRDSCKKEQLLSNNLQRWSGGLNLVGFGSCILKQQVKHCT